MSRLLIVGVRPGSLGWHVAREASTQGWNVIEADLNPASDTVAPLDVSSPIEQSVFWEELKGNVSDVVYAAGVNLEGSILDTDWRGDMAKQMAVNFAGPIETLQRWLNHGREKTTGDNFVTIASNSAYIPRSKSMSYCASKAAVVMAMRCAARELAKNSGRGHPSVYTYSPGWLNGTPMSQEVFGRLPMDVPLHRIPGDASVNPGALAQLIVRNLIHGDQSLNGCDLRIDGGEL